MKIDKNIYKLTSIELAPKLLGKILCRNINNKILKYKITETEAYYSQYDTACHAHKGKTERTKLMFEEGGIAYIYLCYGIHWMLNIVSGEKNIPQAVLIRGIEGYDGPGKLTKFLNINNKLNGENLIISDKIWIENNNNNFDNFVCKFKSTPRIGINYATEEYKNKLWRFVLI